MKKLFAVLMFIFMMSSAALGITASNAHAETESTPKIKLTEAQKNEISAIHKSILEKRKELINKYVEYGLLPEEKGKMIISHFEEHYNNLEKEGFVPERFLNKGHWKHGHMHGNDK